MKHILQKAVVNTRLPYQSASRNLRRYATFIATSNNYDLLTDPTGSRRFISRGGEGADRLCPADRL
ncbi:MAG: VapE domain-containing protein [Parabacteroides merdae]